MCVTVLVGVREWVRVRVRLRVRLRVSAISPLSPEGWYEGEGGVGVSLNVARLD